MKVLGIRWVGVRADGYEEIVGFLRDVLGTGRLRGRRDGGVLTGERRPRPGRRSGHRYYELFGAGRDGPVLLAQRVRLDLADHGAEEPLDRENVLGLTAREREVIKLLARGYTNREIAEELTISVKTASVHVSHILRKLDVLSRLEAAAIAQRLTPGA